MVVKSVLIFGANSWVGRSIVLKLFDEFFSQLFIVGIDGEISSENRKPQLELNQYINNELKRIKTQSKADLLRTRFRSWQGSVQRGITNPENLCKLKGKVDVVLLLHQIRVYEEMVQSLRRLYEQISPFYSEEPLIASLNPSVLSSGTLRAAGPPSSAVILERTVVNTNRLEKTKAEQQFVTDMLGILLRRC